jgi:hypothetical protein
VAVAVAVVMAATAAQPFPNFFFHAVALALLATITIITTFFVVVTIITIIIIFTTVKPIPLFSHQATNERSAVEDVARGF